jgi:hypothetical protein
MDTVSMHGYYSWLDDTIECVGHKVPGARIVEKSDARNSPPLNTAIYYDTADYAILPTGALLRTSCNKITHAFCAFKAAEDGNHVRRDHRYVFEGEEKAAIQLDPTSATSVSIVRKLLARSDIEHPGTYLDRYYGVRGDQLSPSIQLDDYRYTFYAWLDGQDALRCSIDCYRVTNLRLPETDRRWAPLSEVELAIYPRIASEVAKDERVALLVNFLADSLCERFSLRPTSLIKYQRSAHALAIWPTAF